MILNKVLSGIFINTFILYIFYKLYSLDIYNGFQIIFDTSLNGILVCEVLVILGAILWFINDIVKHIIKLLALPFTFIFGGIILILINILMLLLFKYSVIFLNLPVDIYFGGIIDIVIVAIAIAILNLLFKKL